jgi:hypothetical protein
MSFNATHFNTGNKIFDQVTDVGGMVIQGAFLCALGAGVLATPFALYQARHDIAYSLRYYWQHKWWYAKAAMWCGVVAVVTPVIVVSMNKAGIRS